MNASYYPNYFSVDDILATQERTPCKFLRDVPNLGLLNPSNETRDLKAGTNLELPLWLMKSMQSSRPIVKPDLPRVYKETYREILQADPCALDLHKLGLYFYELGSYVKQFDARGDVAKVLMQTFRARFRLLMDLANNVGNDPTVLDRLDVLERKIYVEAHNARRKLNNWLMESGVALEAADMVVNHKKRKRMHLNDFD